MWSSELPKVSDHPRSLGDVPVSAVTIVLGQLEFTLSPSSAPCWSHQVEHP